ncbi:phage protein NinX family protein [Proteus mirabilis]|uniref:phage protein NinX family protein n=1 Tax=Proteus mirabilis TaxID=584 RepID=UPI00234B8C36|nr:phage protein NinX family protein [Proteus mirabilis]MDC6123171.1 DUF2591 family protein [Proteus mirabilis]MDC6136890.1 DUF2591 family protein [Proteus mirabilis]
MNKYTELSDFEINRLIAEMDAKNRYVYFEKEQTIFRKFNNGQTQKFNPCNYPTDAMPIIIENKISLLAGDSNFWCARYGEWNILPCPSGIGFIEKAQVINDIPYRAAMELFLLMKDAERETNT